MLRFRVAAGILIPLAVIALLELVLHLAGYGYSTRFFIPMQVEGRPSYVENQKFGWRFFDPAIARSPRPVVLAAKKAPGTYRIFIMGESAAFGDPQPDFGLPRMLEVLLRERYPEVGFEVVNAAMTAINSHAILPIARDCSVREGDVWVIYMGNNEVVGPFGSGTVFNSRAPNLAVIRASLALKTTRLGELITDVARRLQSREAPQEWGGMLMFLENKVRHDDPRMSVTYAQFERNLQDVLLVGLKNHVKMVVSTVGVNLRDCPPFASMHRPSLTEAQTAEWNRLFGEACTNVDSQAIQMFQKAAEIDATFAELQYRWGKACMRLGRAEEARRHLIMARDYDALRFRADTRINEIVRRNARSREGEGIRFCDGEQLLAGRSADGVPGHESFYEHVHLNFEGNYALAVGLAEEVSKLLGLQAPAVGDSKGLQKSWCSAEECAQHLLWTEWNRYETLGSVMLRFNDPPFTWQSDHGEQVQRLSREMEELLPSTSPQGLARSVAQYAGVIRSTTNDWVFYKNFGRLLQKLGDSERATQAWEQVCRLLPQDIEVRTALGLLLTRSGKLDEAIAQFKVVEKVQPRYLGMLNGYGLAFLAKGRFPEAVKYFERALTLNPNSSETQLNMANALQGLGKTNEARIYLRSSLARKPNNAEALIQLGKMCLGQGWIQEAITNFHKALALEPTEATAHFCLGGAMDMLRRWSEAQSHYAEAVRLRPDYAEARLGLGIEFGREGRHQQAFDQFSEAVRLNPGLIEARLNLGIALTKLQRSAEAVEQFEEALRMSPGNAVARKYLQQLRMDGK